MEYSIHLGGYIDENIETVSMMDKKLLATFMALKI